jgi:hypothetical protein
VQETLGNQANLHLAWVTRDLQTLLVSQVSLHPAGVIRDLQTILEIPKAQMVAMMADQEAAQVAVRRE